MAFVIVAVSYSNKRPFYSEATTDISINIKVCVSLESETNQRSDSPQDLSEAFIGDGMTSMNKIYKMRG